MCEIYIEFHRLHIKNSKISQVLFNINYVVDEMGHMLT